MAKRRKQSTQDSGSFVQSFNDRDAFGAALDEPPPAAVDPDHVAWFDFSAPVGAQIKVFDWWDYSPVATYAAPTKNSPQGHPVAFGGIHGTEKTIYGIFGSIDSMGNYDPANLCALDPLLFLLIAGPTATPTNRNAIGWGGGDGRSYFSSSLPSRAWYASPTLDGATEFGTGAGSPTSWFPENNFLTYQFSNGQLNQINPVTGATIQVLYAPGIGSGFAGNGRGFETLWEKHSWLARQPSSNPVELICYGHTAITSQRQYWSRQNWPPGTNPFCCAHALNPPLGVLTKSFVSFPGPCTDCLGGADHNPAGTFTEYTWGVTGVPYDYGRVGDNALVTKTEFTKLDNTNGLEIPAHTADGACCVSLAGNDVFARVRPYQSIPPNAYDSIEFKVWVRTAVSIPTYEIGDILKWRTRASHLKGI